MRNMRPKPLELCSKHCSTRFPRPELLVLRANVGWMTDVTSHQEHVENESRGSFCGPCISRLTPQMVQGLVSNLQIQCQPAGKIAGID